jgi:hypothetical protein
MGNLGAKLGLVRGRIMTHNVPLGQQRQIHLWEHTNEPRWLPSLLGVTSVTAWAMAACADAVPALVIRKAWLLLMRHWEPGCDKPPFVAGLSRALRVIRNDMKAAQRNAQATVEWGWVELGTHRR